MAVPIFCLHIVFPNWKMLLFITKSSSSMMNSSWGDVGVYVLMYFLIVGMPSDGSIFVYMDSASDVNILDVAALSIIISESGGVFTDLNGKKPDLNIKSILAANPILHPEIKSHLDGHS